MTTHDPYGALRHRDYRLYLFGGLFSNIGSQMVGVAVGWELYERTHSAMALAWVGLAQFLPMILLALPAGQLADRLPRVRLLMFAHSLMIVATLGLAMVSSRHADVRWMYGCLVLTGIVRTIGMSAGQSLMPLLVPRDLFSNAVTWRSSMFHLASTVGPALGGWLIGWFRLPAVVYLAHTGLTVIYLGCLSRVRVTHTGSRTEALTLESLLAGARFVWRTKLVLAAMTLDMFAVLLGGATALLPVYAKDILQVGPAGLGWLRAAPAVGALVMGMTLAHRPPLQRAGRAMLGAVAGYGVATIVFGLSHWFWLSLAMLFITGMLDNISVVVRHTLVQTQTPDELRGRVSAVNGLFISSSNELGEFESGTVAAWFGPVASVVSGGVGTIVVVAVVAARWPIIRRLQSLK